MTCARHPFAADPACGQCYPSAVSNLPPTSETPSSTPTEPAPPAFTIAPTAREALELELVQRLHELPLALDTPAAVEIARLTLERAANWFFWSYTPRQPVAPVGFSSSSVEIAPYELLSSAELRVVSRDELDSVAKIFGASVIPIRAFLNFLGYLARDLETEETADHVRAALHALRARAEGAESDLKAWDTTQRAQADEIERLRARVESLRQAVKGFGLGGITRRAQADAALAEDDRAKDGAT